MQPIFGYPGGKSRAVKCIVKTIGFDLDQYARVAEPFCGGAAFTLGVLNPNGNALLNDMDADLMALWTAIIFHTDHLCEAVMNAEVKASDFYSLKEKFLKPHRPVNRRDAVVKRALEKLIVHKISFSNMGEMSGSPVGGKNQTGAWKFNCRWKPELICKRILKASQLLRGVNLSCVSYFKVFQHLRRDDFTFIDPPYVDAGSKCYKHSFSIDDHVELSKRVRKIKGEWALTYDYHPLILDLYSWANIYDLEFKYFMSSAYNKGETMKVGKELLITC